MVFSSIVFLFLYLPLVLGVYYIVPHRWRNWWLFLVNLVFYGWGEPVYILLMLFSICVNYISGRLIHRYRETENRKAKVVLAVNTAVNLSLLVFFKYFDLLAETISRIPGVSIPSLGLTLPIGISFYTFQTMSYPIDVYRGDADVQKNFIRFGMFVALFPQLIAGPIVRYKDISGQLGERMGSIRSFASGVERFTIGLAKKVLIANNVGALWDACAAMSSRTVAGAWLGAIAFSLQLYFDFSGYSDMAIGLGRMFGFHFIENFNYPYIASSVTDFWRRWHISLSTWFRDYVYIPLGGSRVARGKWVRNLFVVWLLTGIWHGANWTFLVWGLFFFALLLLERTTGLAAKLRGFSHLYTLLMVVVGWVLFRSESLSLAGTYLGAMFGIGATGFSDGVFTYYLSGGKWILLAASIACLPVVPWVRRRARLPRPLVAAAVAVLFVLAVVVCVKATYNPFIYFNF